MSKFTKSKFLMLSIFVMFSLLLEITMFCFLKETIIPKYILMNVSTLILFGLITFLFPSQKASVIYLSTILFIQMLLNLTNCIMYDTCGDIFSVIYFKLLKEAARVFEFSFFSISQVLIFTLIYGIYIALNVTLLKKKIYINDFKDKFSIVLKKQLKFIVSLLFVSTTIYASQILIIKSKDKEDVFGDNYLYTSLSLKTESLKNFGTWGYYVKEFKNVFFSSNTPTSEQISEVNEYLSQGKNLTTDYTGVMKDKNIIMIMMESTQWFAIDEYLTPNLYKLANEGIEFTNHYSKNKTNISEMIGITGSYPIGSTLQLNKINYDFTNSILNYLDDSYVKTYVHPNTGTFYSREKLMPMLGFENMYFYDDLFDDELYSWGDFVLDSETMEKALQYLVPSDTEHFYSYITTLSTHGPYNKSEKNIKKLTELGYFSKINEAIENDKWENPLKDTKVSESFIYYKAMAMDLDKSIGMLIDYLNNKDLLDDTMLVLYGDHNAYYDDISYLMYDSVGGEYYKPYIFKTPLIIYNKELVDIYKENNNIYTENGVNITKFVSTYNIVPTLLDLLGVKYNSNLYLGTSVFDENDYDTQNVFFSLQGGIFNDLIYTINGNDLVYTELEDYDDELSTFRVASKFILNKIKYIEQIYNYNMFNKININIQ